MKICHTCNGSGYTYETGHEMVCGVCGGIGLISDAF